MGVQAGDREHPPGIRLVLQRGLVEPFAAGGDEQDAAVVSAKGAARAAKR